MAISSNLKEMTDKKTGVEIISVHVPKTAGSAFGKVLLRVYGAEGVFLDYPYERDYQRRFMREGDVNVKVIHGHFSPAKYKDKFADAKRITWLREPVSFLISYYCYNKMFRRSRFYDLIEEKNLDFWEFAQMPENQNVMSVYLGKIKLEDFFFVGIQNFFEEDLQELRSMMSWQEITISRENNNRDSDYQRIKKEVLRDESLVKKVERINGEDIEMYQEALNLREKRCGGNRGGIQKARVKQQEKKQVRGGIKSNKFQQKSNVEIKDSPVEIISVHVPKTAGTSLRKCLIKVYGEEKILFDYGKCQKLPFNEVISEIKNKHIRVIHGHFFPERYYGYFQGAKRIIWLREPIKRLISHYWFYLTMQKRKKVTYTQIEFMKKKLLIWAKAPSNVNFMSRYCHLENIENFWFVGITEFLREDLTEIKTMLKWPEVKIPNANQHQYPKIYKDFVQSVLSDRELIDKLNTINSQDIEIYKKALTLREKRMKTKV